MKFDTFDISNIAISTLMSKIIFIQYLAPLRPKIKSAQNLLKFGTFDISNIPISILMSQIIFIKFLPPVGPELVLKFEMLRIC